MLTPSIYLMVAAAAPRWKNAFECYRNHDWGEGRYRCDCSAREMTALVEFGLVVE
jgi:hypothetical protein